MPRPIIKEIDIDGEDLGIEEYSAVDRPATARTFRMFKGTDDARTKPAEVESCVATMLQDPDFTAEDFESREERAFAICQAEAGKEDEMPKQDEPAVEPAAEPEFAEEAPAASGVIEIPASAEPWPFSSCINEAMGMGLEKDAAVGVCQFINETLGDPSDPEAILVPEGTTTEGLLNEAIITTGLGVPEGGAEPPQEMAVPVGVDEGKGCPQKNRWWEMARTALGIKIRPRSPEMKMFERLQKEVNALKTDGKEQQKTNADLMEIVRRLLSINARDHDVALTDLDVTDLQVASAIDGPTAAVPAAVAVAETIDEDAKQKDETPEQTIERLMAEVGRLNAIVSGAAGDETEPEVGVGGELEHVAAPGVAAAVSMEPQLETTEDIQMTVPTEESPVVLNKLRRRSPTPDRTKANGDLVASTLFGGAPVSRSDREALGWYKGGR